MLITYNTEFKGSEAEKLFQEYGIHQDRVVVLTQQVKKVQKRKSKRRKKYSSIQRERKVYVKESIDLLQTFFG